MTQSGRWHEIRARMLEDPEARHRYNQTRHSVATTRQLLQIIDAECDKAGLTKADLARRVGTSPAAVRRLLSSGDGSPALQTMLQIFETLGLQVTLERKAGASGTFGLQVDPTAQP